MSTFMPAFWEMTLFDPPANLVPVCVCSSSTEGHSNCILLLWTYDRPDRFWALCRHFPKLHCLNHPDVLAWPPVSAVFCVFRFDCGNSMEGQICIGKHLVKCISENIYQGEMCKPKTWKEAGGGCRGGDSGEDQHICFSAALAGPGAVPLLWEGRLFRLQCRFKRFMLSTTNAHW